MITRQHLTGALLSALLATTACSPTEAPNLPQSTIFPDRWNSGLERDEADLQMQRFDDNTLVIRQSLRSNFEAPFMYLLFGEDKALLIDTGAGEVDLRAFVDTQIAQHLQETGKSSLSLVVMHTHGHGDHVAGDPQFVDRPDTVVIGHKRDEVASFFGLARWPDATGSFDLGGRTVTVIPTPGHHDSHVMIYDPATKLLFSGDTLYPGRLYFRCHGISELKRSIDRVAEFTAKHEVDWVLGAHIELAASPGKTFNSDDRKRPDERLLELSPRVITDLQQAIDNMREKPRVEPYTDFILFPVPMDPSGKTPPDWCPAT